MPAKTKTSFVDVVVKVHFSGRDPETGRHWAPAVGDEINISSTFADDLMKAQYVETAGKSAKIKEQPAVEAKSTKTA